MPAASHVHHRYTTSRLRARASALSQSNRGLSCQLLMCAPDRVSKLYLANRQVLMPLHRTPCISTPEAANLLSVDLVDICAASEWSEPGTVMQQDDIPTTDTTLRDPSLALSARLCPAHSVDCEKSRESARRNQHQHNPCACAPHGPVPSHTRP